MSKKKPNGYWTEERLFTEALRYQTRVDFREGSPSAYVICKRLGILDAACTHMVPNRRKKLTPEDWVKWLEDDGRGIVPAEDYISNHAQIRHQCAEGHEWSASPANLKAGKGCPHCAGKIIEDYQLLLDSLGKGIAAVEPYVNTKTPILHRCREGHEWSVSPQSLIAGTGCPHCAGLVKLTPEDWDQWLKDDGRGYIALEPYVNAGEKIRHRCSEGHEWEATPNNIRTKSGWPGCADTGFNPDKPAILYVAEHDAPQGVRINIGITNLTFEERYHGRDLQTVIRVNTFPGSGVEIESLERRAHEALSQYLDKRGLGLRLKKGTRETFDIPYETALAEVRRLISEAA